MSDLQRQLELLHAEIGARAIKYTHFSEVFEDRAIGELCRKANKLQAEINKQKVLRPAREKS